MLRPDIAFLVGMLGRYMSNPRASHWKATKRVMRYLKRTKDFMFTYRRSDSLEIIRYSNSGFAGCKDSKQTTSGYVSCYLEELYCGGVSNKHL